MKDIIAFVILEIALIALGVLLFSYSAWAGWLYLVILMALFFYYTMKWDKEREQ